MQISWKPDFLIVHAKSPVSSQTPREKAPFEKNVVARKGLCARVEPTGGNGYDRYSRTRETDWRGSLPDGNWKRRKERDEEALRRYS